MARSIFFTATLLSTLLTGVSASPTPSRQLAKRWEDGVDCTYDTVGDKTPGRFFAFDSEGINVYCEDIDDNIKADNGYTCYMTTENTDELGNMVKCPGDPAPKKNPDGTDVTGDTAGGVISAWCSARGSLPGPLGKFASTVGCLQFGYYEAHGDPAAEAEAGAKGICDTIFAGACTWFLNISGDITKPMVDPCDEDPESLACQYV